MDWILIFIIMGIISSLMNKKNREPKKRQAPASRPRTYERTPDYQPAKPARDWKSPFPDLDDTLKDLEKQFEGEIRFPWEDQQKDKEIDIKKPVEIKKVEKAPKEQKVIQEKEESKSVANPETDQDLYKRKFAQKNIFEQPGINQAAQGMMWAEVFGYPRSKNPHYSRKNK